MLCILLSRCVRCGIPCSSAVHAAVCGCLDGFAELLPEQHRHVMWTCPPAAQLVCLHPPRWPSNPPCVPPHCLSLCLCRPPHASCITMPHAGDPELKGVSGCWEFANGALPPQAVGFTAGVVPTGGAQQTSKQAALTYVVCLLVFCVSLAPPPPHTRTYTEWVKVPQPFLPDDMSGLATHCFR